jgi:hypothetical protein
MSRWCDYSAFDVAVKSGEIENLRKTIKKFEFGNDVSILTSTEKLKTENALEKIYSKEWNFQIGYRETSSSVYGDDDDDYRPNHFHPSECEAWGFIEAVSKHLEDYEAIVYDEEFPCIGKGYAWLIISKGGKCSLHELELVDRGEE